MVELHRSIHAVSRASGEPWHRAKAAMLVADCASEALTTEDELRRERSGVQCEAQASLSALRRELPPAAPRTCAALELWLLLQLNSLLRVPYVRMHFRPSDQAYWVVACHKACLCGEGVYIPGFHPRQKRNQWFIFATHARMSRGASAPRSRALIHISPSNPNTQ